MRRGDGGAGPPADGLAGVQSGLPGTVRQAREPAHTTLWISGSVR